MDNDSKKIKLTKTRQAFAELGNHLISVSGVTYNENDDRSNYLQFKITVGAIAKQIDDASKKWVDEAKKKFNITDEFTKELLEMDAELEKAENPEDVKEIEEKYKDAREEEAKFAEKFVEFNNEVVSLEVDSVSLGLIPLNINGAYLNIIKDVIVEV